MASIAYPEKRIEVKRELSAVILAP